MVQDGVTGCLNADLKQAVLAAQDIDTKRCIEYAHNNSWLACTQVFANYMYDNHDADNSQDRAITNQAFWCL